MKGGLHHLVGGAEKEWTVCSQLPGHPGMEKGSRLHSMSMVVEAMGDPCPVLSVSLSSGYLSYPAPETHLSSL